jgi:hypothetical protein
VYACLSGLEANDRFGRAITDIVNTGTVIGLIVSDDRKRGDEVAAWSAVARRVMLAFAKLEAKFK